ncbi:MAG: putative manganese-dependent inorganic diphosphatase [Opitutales bacterium]
MPQPIYVIGHRNPDADAVCSAIGYAAFKHAQGDAHYIPARCGNSNARIDAILGRFEVPLPRFIGDLTPRVRDIMVRDVLKVPLDATCAEALELIDRYDVRALPVVNSNGQVEGVVTIFSLGEFFIPKPREPRKMRHVHTSIASIIKALDAEVLCSNDPYRVEDLYVRIGAMDIRSFGKFAESENIEPGQSVIVVGDRWDIQQKSVQLGVRMLVVTGALDVDEDIVALARERNVSLVVSRFDSASTSWIIRTATRLAPMIEKGIMTFTPEEKLGAVRRKMSGNYKPIYCVCDDAGKLLGLFSNSDILKPVPTQIVMVDHNEISQAVPGAQEVTITEIIDHHRLGNPPSQQPILFRNEPVGSTCTIVGDLFRKSGLKPEASIAGVLMGGIISDTLHLQGPTSTEKDDQVLRWLESLAGLPSQELADIIFRSGSIILSSTPASVITSDLKAYDEGEIRFSVSQVEELGFNNFWDNKEDLVMALAEHRKREGFYFSALLVTDINKQNSLLVLAADQDFLDNITYPCVTHPNIFDLTGIVSRKKQLIPFLTATLTGMGVGAAPVRA